MPIDDTLARWSDISFETAFVVYLLAAIAFLGQLATTRSAELHNMERLRTRVIAATSSTPGRIPDAPRRVPSERMGRTGLGLVMVALTLHVGSIVLRGIAAGRPPWGNMYEFVSVTCAAGVLAALVVLRSKQLRTLWLFVLVPTLILLFVAGTVLYANAAPVVPALQSYWLPVHVSIVSLGSGVFLISGVASALFLIRMKHPEASGSRASRIVARLPSAQTLDIVAYKTTIFAFPLFGVGVILGAIWAEAAWGRFWGWDPKETVSFITWIVYASYLHARATSGWRNTRAAWINIAGFVAMLFNLFIINMVVSGLHSYAGLN
ncbi:c-type cytochrome biogenesis protein CcsB [Rhodococcus sp. 05-2255-1e]|uniref:c-type cytochrome biogenesis protein CcsB n=1 Tax=unclassified Rhodococcus (in: high G+C Gram-positive bacteria) TaxID=192944 RepID=UPI000B9B75A4|nr:MULTISPECIES: c-type cytochrome biogenesis protein CcsB [unclassified Rhodococcus (in: high G+C Gram-positive bacteria)]OZC63476.1 c-type cytochrome biogenesis protein CcsB [Rhodococcus sp. 06-470-2]OZC94835.1 c-type cytochrome biogenesis protein CcsB [Rhodococcus sp. 06-235-1A]OZE24041.1 c-type cytochrome biogenesis protein CcsB [Rhodococcus sp. 05-2255-1e]OZE37309.1 c-type cytochrome biogenesis protein CcsB [Rhodococcus sp. 05-2254-4]OZE45028.1 c-type cytochrome biogenesis protein CcsB [R